MGGAENDLRVELREPRRGGGSKPRLRYCRFMRGRRDLDKFVARFVHREQARILDLEEGASGRLAADREIFAI